jgi:hypothetical protein
MQYSGNEQATSSPTCHGVPEKWMRFDNYTVRLQAYRNKEQQRINNMCLQYSVWGCLSPNGRVPRWRIGECSPDMEGRWEIKYHPRTKADEDWPAALEVEEDVRVSTAAEAEEPAPAALRLEF